VRDVTDPNAGRWWLATSHALLRVDMLHDHPVLSRHLPMSGLRAVAATAFGVLAGGDAGLDILHPDTCAVLGHLDAGPVLTLAARGSSVFIATGDAIRTFRLQWVPDARGRRRIPVLDEVASYRAVGARSWVLVGRHLVVARDSELAVYEHRADGALTAAGTIALPGVHGIGRIPGADRDAAVVALVQDRAVLVRVDSLVDSVGRRPETLDLPEIPWYVGARRAGDVLVRPNPEQGTLDTFTLLDRVDLARRDALLGGASAANRHPSS